MINNDILRRLRYALKLNDTKVLETFKLAGLDVPPYHLANIMRKEDEEGFVLCQNDYLVAFLDGLIIRYRGKQEGREPQSWPKGQFLSNNEVLRKIRIALELKEQDMIDIMALANIRVSKPELSALFRKPGHRNYSECGNQFLRNFITGLTRRNREEASAAKPQKATESKASEPDKPASIDPWQKRRK